MKTKRKILLAMSVGIISVAGLGAISMAGSAGQCGLRIRAGEQKNNPSCGMAFMSEENKAGSGRVENKEKTDSCGDVEAKEDKASHDKVKKCPVNVKCPIMGTEIDKEKLTEELTVEHRGHTVGLCCDGCPEQWGELSDEEKDEKLAESIELRWHSSPDEALAQAESKQQLIVAEFHAEWCGWCQKWKAETLPDQNVQLRLLDFSLLDIDTDDQPEVAQKYGITGLPTTVILDSEGEVVLRSSGFKDAGQYLALLAEAEIEAGTARPVNAHCPVMGLELDKDEVPDDLMREHKGQDVGFCCPSCPESWDGLSDEEKDEKLRESL